MLEAGQAGGMPLKGHGDVGQWRDRWPALDEAAWIPGNVRPDRGRN